MFKITYFYQIIHKIVPGKIYFINFDPQRVRELIVFLYGCFLLLE